MGLFSKKRNNDYDAASRGLNDTNLASDRLIIQQMIDDDELAAKYVDNLKNGSPLILNFEGLDEFSANKMLAFFAGAAYALDGKTVMINDTTYLFARRVDFMDGSLQNFIQSIPKK